jgi:hypothetical protein
VRRASNGPAARSLAGGLILGTLLSAGCASRRTAARFEPASDADARAALDAWSAIRRRADALPPSRLLYDARMSGKGVPAVPGTLAVTYDGSDVTRASLTGPFGKPVAEYANGTVTGGGRQPFPVDPRLLRSVLLATWPSDVARVDGCNGAECLLVFEGAVSASAVVDRALSRVVSLRVTGDAGALSAEYGVEGTSSGGGEPPSPWPRSIAVEQEGGSRRLALKLVASEPAAAAEGGGPGS